MGTFKPVLKKTCESSSMKALPRIMKATTRFQKFLWILALLLGLGFATYQLVRLFMGYFRFATGVNIVEEIGSPPFPDVTVCPLDTSWTIRMMERQFGDEVNFDAYRDKLVKLQQQLGDEDPHLAELNDFKGYIQNMKGVKEKANRIAELFVVKCTVGGKWIQSAQCKDHPNVTKSVFLDPLLGLCIHFQLRHEDLEHLDVVVYLDNQPVPIERVNRHLLGLKSPIGARVVIHPQDSFPDLTFLTKPVPAGVDITFKVRGSQRTILEHPYSDCITQEESRRRVEDGNSGFALNRHGFECYRLKGRDYILRNCSCLYIFYDSNEFDMKGEHVDLCGYIDNDNISSTIHNMACAQKALQFLFETRHEISCPTPCKSHTYDYSTLSLDWPEEQYQLQFYEEYIKESSIAPMFGMYEGYFNGSTGDGAPNLPDFSQIRKNFSLITISKDQFKYLHYSDTPLVTFESLFGNMGGVLSLWIGITFITIIEIIDFVYQLCTKKNEKKTLAQ